MVTRREEVVALYRNGDLTLDEVALRVGLTKGRVHQILKSAGVDTSARVRRGAGGELPQEEGKKYRSYQLAAETRTIIDRLAEVLGVSRTKVIVRAVEELAARELPPAPAAGRPAGAGGSSRGRPPGRG